MKAVMTSKGQITIPVEIRERLGLAAGQVLEFDEQAAYLKATKVFDRERMGAVLGRFRTQLKGRSAAQLLDETRGRVALPVERVAARKR
jgi:AbrB family looped-hinge helix DNA binding protein